MPRVRPNPSVKRERRRQATKPARCCGLSCTARAWRPAVVARLPRTFARSQMQHRTAVRYACYSLAGMLVLCSLWCLLWVISSLSMAFTDCAGAYDLFAENPRCRQPSLAGLLAFAFVICAAGAVFLGRRFRL